MTGPRHDRPTVERRDYRPHLPVHGWSAYAVGGKQLVVDGRVLYVERVVRAWKDQTGLHVDPLADGSRRRFEPETPDSNGRNPCLLYVAGEKHPWYFDSGWDTVGVLSLGHRFSDD